MSVQSRPDNVPESEDNGTNGEEVATSAPTPPVEAVEPELTVPPAPPEPPTAVTAPPAAGDFAPPAPGGAVPPAPSAPVPPTPGGTTVPPAPSAAANAPAPETALAPRAPSSEWFAPFSTKVLLGGLAHVGIAVGAAFVGGLLLLLLLFALGSSGAGSTPIGSISDIVDGFGVIVGLLFSLTAVVFGGELTLSLGGDLGSLSGGGSASVWVFPLLLTLAALVAVLWWGVRQGRSNPLPTRLHRAAYGFAVGLATGIVLLLIALIFTVRIDAARVEIALTGAGFRVVLFSTLLVGAAAFLGSEVGARAQQNERWTASAARLFAAAPRIVREWLSYTAFGAAAFGVVGALFLIVAAWDDLGFGGIAVGLIAALNIAPLAAAIGHLGGVLGSGAVAGGSASSTLTVFNAPHGAVWLLVLVAVLLTAFMALWIGTRRPRTAVIDWRSVWQLPLVVLGAWLIFAPIFFGLGAGASGAAGLFSGSLSGGIGVALWSVLVFAVWAALVEVGARTLPRIVYGFAPAVLRALVGRRTLATWVAGVSPVAAAPVATAGAVPPPPPGTPQAPASEAAPLPAPAPLSPKAKRGLIIGASAVGGVVLLGIAASVAVGIVNSTRTPEVVAKQYLDHIAAGDAEAANALVDPNVSKSERQFLTNEVLASATERITDVSVKNLRAGDDNAVLSVTYKLDGVTHDAKLQAERGDPEWLVLDTWELTSSLATPVLLLPHSPGEVSLGGVPVELGDSQTKAVLYPGVYDFTVEGSFFELDDTQLLVTRGANPKELKFVPTAKLTQSVAEQAGALLKKCVADTARNPEGCPFSTYTYNDDTKVTRALQGEPEIEITAGQQVRVSGTVLASYTEKFFGTTRERSTEQRYTLRGEISFDGDKATVAFDDSRW